MQPPIRDEAAKEIAATPILDPKDGISQGGSDGRPRGGGMEMGGGGMGGGGGAAPVSLRTLRNLNTFASFKNPVFLLFYGAVGGQMAAMNMEMLARSLLIYRMTGSGTILGFMVLAASLPQLFFSLFGGVLADRIQKKYVLLAGMLGSAVITFGIALTLVVGFVSEERGSGSWWILIVAALIKGVLQGIMMPSRQAIVAEIVGQEQLMNALALSNMEMNINRLVMPAVSGFIVELYGFEAAYFFMTAMYLIAAAFAWLMPRTGTMSLRGRGALADIKEGLVYVRHETTLLIILGVTFVVVLLSMPYMQLLPVFTEDVFEVGAGGMGVLMSVSGIGALVASLVLASLPNKKRGAMFLWGSFVLGLALVGVSFSSYWFPSLAWPLALGFIVVVGVGQTARMTLANTLLQYYVQDEYRGRVMALFMMDFGLTSLGVFVAGIMTDEIGIRWTIGGMAAVLAVFCVFAIAFIPRLRRLD